MHRCALTALLLLCGITHAPPPPSEGVIAYYCPEQYCLSPAAEQPSNQTRPTVTCTLVEHGKTITTKPEYIGPRRESGRQDAKLAPNDTVARNLLIPPYQATMPVIGPTTGWPIAECCQVYSQPCPSREASIEWGPSVLSGPSYSFENGSVADRIIVREICQWIISTHSFFMFASFPSSDFPFCWLRTTKAALRSSSGATVPGGHAAFRATKLWRTNRSLRRNSSNCRRHDLRRSCRFPSLSSETKTFNSPSLSSSFFFFPLARLQGFDSIFTLDANTRKVTRPKRREEDIVRYLVHWVAEHKSI